MRKIVGAKGFVQAYSKLITKKLWSATQKLAFEWRIVIDLVTTLVVKIWYEIWITLRALYQVVRYDYLRPWWQQIKNRVPAIQKFTDWKFSKTLTRLSAGMFALVFVLMVVQSSIFAAPDLSDTWDLNTPANYTYSSGIEMTGGVARLKAQNYTDDANTSALYHFDESGGSNISDSSSNGNDGTMSGGSFVTGNLNNAASLNGVDEGISVPNSSSLQLGQTQSIEAWTKFTDTFNNADQSRRNQVVDKGDYQLYYNNETGKLTYELANANADTWTQAGGNSIDDSWDYNGKRSVNALVKAGSDIYAGIGVDVGDAAVWKYNGSTWTLIGGGAHSINNSWDAQTYEGVYALATDGSHVFAGLGRTAGDGEVWEWDGSSWTKIGGDSINNGWTNYVEQIWSMDYVGGKLYVGTGYGANDAEVWQWNGITWTQIGGDSLNSGWTTNYEEVAALTNDGTNLYAGLGQTAGDSEVWKWNGTSWSKIGGNSVNSSWGNTLETVVSLRYFGGTLYAGLGTGTGDAEVWSYNGATWTQIGGDGLNSSWAASTYEQVASFGYDGSNLYAGLGTGNGDGEVWQWNGASWNKIGGDGDNNSWPTAYGDTVNTLLWDSGKLYAGTYDSGGTGWVYEWDGASWEGIGGNYVNKSWGYYGLDAVQVMQAVGDYLYAGMGNGSGEAMVWRYNGTTWQLIGGQGVNNSWAPNTFEQVMSMASFKGDLYVGLGTTASGNDGQVWKWDGSTWTQVGGLGVNSSWPATTNHYGEVDSLASDDSYLYAGLGIAANDGEVWRYDGSTWTQIGGDSLNSGWTNYAEAVYSLDIYQGHLVAGIGRGTGDAEVWDWNGSTWTKIGGDGINSGWSGYQSIESLIVYNNELYAGLGYTTGSAVLWKYDGSNWAEVGGDDINGSWGSSTYERVKTLAVFNGALYVGLGNSTGDGEAWQLDNGNWDKIGGNGINSGWAGTIEEVESFSAYQGKLYAGTGYSGNADAAVWAWGDNLFLESNKATWDTNWHHVAVTFDGTNAKMYIDGVLDNSTSKLMQVNTSNHPLLIGYGYGGREYGKPEARFKGSLDEIRLSNIARTSFTDTPYSTASQTLTLNDAVRTSGVWHWDSFSQTQLPNGGTINYRLSNDDGASWLYWDGSSWSTSNNASLSNSPAVITSHFDEFPVTFDGMKWQAVFNGDGTEQVALDGVSAQSTSDAVVPSVAPSNLQAYKANGGSALSAGAWTNSSSPYFTWDPGTDADSGVYGYCAYLGTDNSADPVTAKGLLGTSPLDTGGNCAFIVSGNSLDLATPSYLGAALTSSNSSYYLTLKTIDKAGNVGATTAQFNFKFDNTPPSNPGFITAPSGFINTKDVQMSWSTAGASAPDDSNSGVAGLQYRIGPSGTWYGDSHSGTGDMTDLLANDGVYNTQDPPDYDNLAEGINTVYFRTWDNAGNYTSTYATATLKINTTGAPSEPNNLVASPSSNTSNSFGFDWDPPTTYVGDVNNITYCYTVNTIPSAGSCSWTGAGSTELTVGAYATQPGVNTMYIAARDESSNINYANYASVGFTANTTAPGIPLNTDIVDVSIKNTSNWRLAITWDAPTNVGEGISKYRIYRSTNGTSFSQVGSSSSTTYIDAGLSQQTYYYKVSACDSTNNCGASGTVVSEYPTGKFTSPAVLTSGPFVSSVTTKKATVRWSTDRASDSKIAIGTKSGTYGASEIGNSSQVSSHEIKLSNLSPGTTYYFKAKWTDEDGNTGKSQEQTFTTSPAPTIKEATASNVGLDSADISFTTKGAKKAIVYYGTSESFGGIKQVNTSSAESTYQVRLDSLQDGTKYYFMISTIDDEGDEYRGNIDSFVTPPRPHISNLRFQPIDGEPTSTQQVTWDTNVPSSSQVVYTVLNGAPIEVQESKLVTSHKITIRDLRDDSQYNLIAQSRDASGNLATSDAQSFRTALDTRPPVSSKVVVESSIRGSGSEARGQIVVSWHTDEPSTSQVAYTEGSNATVFNSRTAEDTRLATEHIVIISDLPTSRVFSVQPISKDKAGNEGDGQAQTAIIGRASDSAITIVFDTLRKIFGL
ncbi:hypothetical protein KDA23_00595 [Candidatus Saccharibacteria bacterium]|nr:hypothetical protein [Candidatus Saccharibacteria bacterium]